MHTRRLTALAGALVFAAQMSFASSKSSDSKSLQFFGTLTDISADQNSITVHNKKKNADATFQVSDDTHVTRDKQSISPHELKVAEMLVVYYVSENDISRARKISVRENYFKKKKSQTQ